ncbi:hypothetical protein ES288_D11G287800v1 [Gossypium darwinii]|uniref:Secreted protein n=1 Tax=Gossypium darwinii TaxID=34276 RepID=A0A5D2AQW9_GOSDA|nr:hypothetical protein ES288_D11G287800v1 [Gossypium darwinii]
MFLCESLVLRLGFLSTSIHGLYVHVSSTLSSATITTSTIRDSPLAGGTPPFSLRQGSIFEHISFTCSYSPHAKQIVGIYSYPTH